MNYNKEKFLLVLDKIKASFESQNKMADALELSSSYITKIYDDNTKNPPAPEYLQKIADNSRGITNYQELMEICGYYEETLDTITYNIYNNLKDFSNAIHLNDKGSYYQVGDTIETFQNYLSDLSDSLTKSFNELNFAQYYDKNYYIEDYAYHSGFWVLYDSFIKCMNNKNYIIINDYQFIDWFNIEDIYNNLEKYEDLSLLSYKSDNISISKEDIYIIIQYIKDFSKCLNLSFLSDFDNNALTELFKKKVNNDKEKNKSEQINIGKNSFDKLFNVPVLGKIAAGQPILAEEYLEGYLPVEPNIYGMTNQEEYFYLKVSGDSMNQKVQDGDYVLIHKQDYAEDGDVIVAIVNGDNEATLKRYKKLNEQFILLEPMSTNPIHENRTIDLKETNFQVIGKAIGKFGKF